IPAFMAPVMTSGVRNSQVEKHNQTKPRKKGIKIRNEEYKVQAFVDDLAFIAEDPMNTGKILLHQIEKFGEVAGFKVNRNKTKMIVNNLKREVFGNMAIPLDSCQ
uniref:Reverse transcriptase domain-containing protein n=1 Tax=Laticauda laticaudata TaxID=8630 RepID=A0A8C5WQC7_LATLA